MRALIIASLIFVSSWRAFAADGTATRANADSTPAQTVAKQINTSDFGDDPKFQEKLRSMLSRIEKSITLLRVQITQNQSAPYLADLYMQLGDLLSQKSTVLYYLQMEHDKNTDLKVKETKKFSPVVAAQQEAIAVYEQLLKEFPKFDRTQKVMFRLALAQKSIDEGVKFADTSEKLIAAFPQSDEAIQARLLLGQYFYDLPDFEAALKNLNAIKDSPKPFERNAARYRIGLIMINEGKHADALKNFEAVATDAELKDEDNPNEVNLKTRSVKNNIKREALIDSVRAYTEVFVKDPDPVAYYSRVAPTEALFQETIEKLAFRYIFLKKYNFAVRLLRALSERTADSQKIVNIYHEVLQMIPISDRIGIPAEEIRFVLEKYGYWSTHYVLTPDLKKKSHEFFETQLRELGTRSHDLAKVEKDEKKKQDLLERARQFYALYIGFFRRDPNVIKIATNLADVYYNQARYMQSASIYMRLFEGEFGTPKQKETLVQNAILALQKPANYDFYEQLRSKGLLVKAIRSYQQFSPAKKKDPALNFALAKTLYEQGLYDQALSDLLAFMKNYPDAREVESASELVLNYFNTRSDFKGLVSWSDKMLALQPRSPELRKHLADVKAKALLKRLDEQIKTQKNYDVFAQGKNYLQQAMNSSDSNLRSVAFEQALGRSRAEKDITTFLQAATVMANAEKNPAKKADLLNSMADEQIVISRFYGALKILNQIANGSQFDRAVRQKATEKILRIDLMLHDPEQIATLGKNPLLKSIPADLKSSLQAFLSELMTSDLAVPVQLLALDMDLAQTPDDWVTLYKAQFKWGPNSREQIARQALARCKQTPGTALCNWATWPGTMADAQSFAASLTTTKPTIQNVQTVATRLTGVLDEINRHQGSGDPQMDILVTLTSADSYHAFARFLEGVAQAAPQIAAVLREKAQESEGSAVKARAQCAVIVTSSELISPTNRACALGRIASLEEALKWPRLQTPVSANADPVEKDADELQKTIFVSHKDWKPYFDLAESYLAKKHLNHAMALATNAGSLFPQNAEEFLAISGCAAVAMGFYPEARFTLNKASELNGHKQECLMQIRNKFRKQ